MIFLRARFHIDNFQIIHLEISIKEIKYNISIYNKQTHSTISFHCLKECVRCGGSESGGGRL